MGILYDVTFWINLEGRNEKEAIFEGGKWEKKGVAPGHFAKEILTLFFSENSEDEQKLLNMLPGRDEPEKTAYIMALVDAWFATVPGKVRKKFKFYEKYKWPERPEIALIAANMDYLPVAQPSYVYLLSAYGKCRIIPYGISWLVTAPSKYHAACAEILLMLRRNKTVQDFKVCPKCYRVHNQPQGWACRKCSKEYKEPKPRTNEMKFLEKLRQAKSRRKLDQEDYNILFNLVKVEKLEEAQVLYERIKSGECRSLCHERDF